jgi:small subunit ribosomal protein S14
MAKESMKAREVKREKNVAKYAEKRKALLEAGDFVGLQKLPKTLHLFVYITDVN